MNQIKLLWYVRDLDQSYSKECWDAYNHLVSYILPKLPPEVPGEFVYCEVSNTTNLVLPEELIRAGMAELLKLSGFEEKPIPTKDIQGSEDLKKALLAGSNFNKQWH